MRRPMRVARVGLTPVKGTRHQAQDSVELSQPGPVGDRVFCLVDPARGQVLRTVAHGSLLAATTSWQDGVLTVTLGPDTAAGVPQPRGETIEVDYWGRPVRVDVVAGPWAALFSRYLGRPVALGRARPGDVVYGDQVTVITTAALATLGLDPERDGTRFRATFRVDGDGADEQTWVGRELALGPARVRLTGPVVRCAVVDLNPTTGERDRRLLAHLPRTGSGEPVFGLQGRVTRPGLVRPGDPVALVEARDSQVPARSAPAGCQNPGRV